MPPRLKHDVGIKGSALRWIRSYLTNDSTIFFSDEELASNGSKLYCLLNPFVTVVEIYTNEIKLSFMNMSQYDGDLNKESLSHNKGYFQL